jgi:hypothetical protein
MPGLESLLPSLVVAVLLVFMLWFVAGTQGNIRLGNRLMRWLQEGLPLLGPRATLRWLGSSVAELTIVEPSHPFREAQILVVLEPRDVGLLWAYGRARGRRDFIIVRASLRRAPRHELEIRDRRGWTERLDHERLAEDGWRRFDWPAPEIEALGRSGNDEALARRAWDRLEAASGGAWRLSVQQTVPHLEVHIRPPDTAAVSSARLIGTVRELALSLSAE